MIGVTEVESSKASFKLKGGLSMKNLPKLSYTYNLIIHINFSSLNCFNNNNFWNKDNFYSKTPGKMHFQGSLDY